MNPSRRRVLQVLGLGGFSLLAGRTAWLQVVAGPTLAAEAQAGRTLTWVNRALRGNILGRDGTVLASSVVTYDIGVNQVKVAQYSYEVPRQNPLTGETVVETVGYGAAAAAAQIAPILGVDPLELGAKMVGDSTYAIIAESVPPDTWRQVNALGINGVEPDQRTRRTYPAGNVAGNVLGLTRENEERERVGIAGLESTQDEVLTGINGKGSVEVGNSGEIIPTGEQHDTPAVPGTSVRTTINPDLQRIAQAAIDEVVDAQSADWGCVAVMEPATGKLLVLADSHSVDPADPGQTAEENRGARSVEAIFEPGSVGKVVTFAAALEEGTITPQDTWTVPDTWTAPNGEVFRDSHDHPVQQLTSAQVLVESSNVGTVQIGDTLSDETRYAYMEKFGWGSQTGVELPYEPDGLIYPPDQWDERTRYTTMFGQGVACSTLQAVQVLSAIANGGVLIPPRVVDAWIGPDGTVTPQVQPEGRRVISQEAATTLTEMLIGVTQEGGTAESASIDGYLVAGKTGTTEILTEDGTVASFVGFTPARDPAIAVAVIVYRPEGVYGGVVSAPVFRKVALATMHTLGIAPDPTVIAAQAAAQADAQVQQPAQDATTP
ncbi:peptidoglycan D,D-transpeptidase FtsI family protein [Actinomyces oricola]